MNPLFANHKPMTAMSLDTAVNVLCAYGFLEALNIDRADLLCLLTHAASDWDVPSPGSWFYLDLHEYTHKTPEQKYFFESAALGASSIAYHGTSFSTACLILAASFRWGSNVTGGRKGVYMEGEARRLCTLNYAVYVHVCLPRTHPLQQFSCILELIVDSSRGRSVHFQWVQPLGSFYIDGLYLHCFDLMSLYKSNFFVWFRCHSASLQHLAETKDKHLLESTWELQMEHYQRTKQKNKKGGSASSKGPPDDDAYQ
jgi:hypothetical protein